MREITTHQVNGCNEQLKITVLDERGQGGASHRYDITGFDANNNPAFASPGLPMAAMSFDRTSIVFQNGPIAEVGTNGATHEAYLAVLIDRLQDFQGGPYSNDFNARALDYLLLAQQELQARTRERLARGVEGTHQR